MEEEADQPKRRVKGSRKAHTHRKKSDDPPDPKPRPQGDELGQLTKNLDDILRGGPNALEAANRLCAKLAKKHGEIFEARWMLLTPYLQRILDSPMPDTFRLAPNTS